MVSDAVTGEDTSLKGNVGGKRGKHVSDREHVVIDWFDQPLCPNCGDALIVIRIKVNDVPYLHVDLVIECPTCLNHFLLGVPKDKLSGMALIIFDTNPDIAAHFRKLGDRKCPFGHGIMWATKVFGDWLPNPKKVELQWKCPQCYVTRHEVIERPVPSIGESGLTEYEEHEFYKKLKKMGYVE